MDSRLTADILAVCDTLGTSDGVKYYPDPQCLSSAKDLVLYLKRDSKSHGVRILLGETKIVQKDLLPLFKMTETSEELCEILLRLMVNLTSPLLLLYHNGILPSDSRERSLALSITTHLLSYKLSFIDEEFWTILTTKLSKLIENMETLLEAQRLTVERMLVLIRNVLLIPANPSEELRSDGDVSIHDQIIWVQHKSGLLDLLLYMSAADATREFCMHVVEIMNLIFREQSGKQLGKTQIQKTEEERIEDSLKLKKQMESEKIASFKNRFSSRSFGGTYVVKGVESISGKNQICHKPLSNLSQLSLDDGKKAKKTPKNRRDLVDSNMIRKSTLSMRLLLKEFCLEFLHGAYNALMRSVKSHLGRGRKQENDEIYYLQAMRFFMEFNRYATKKFSIALVSETMSVGTFHYVQSLMSNYHELMTTDKEQLKLWSKRAHISLSAYKELLSTLYVMGLHRGCSEAAKTIQSTIFYLPEYRELCVSLLATYESSKLSRNYLCDLVETNHLFLRMLEASTKEEKILVRSKGKKRQRKKSKVKKPSNKSRGNSSKKAKVENDEVMWNYIEDDVVEFLETSFEPEEMIPFDTLSDVPIDDQKVTAFGRISSYLTQCDFLKAVSLLRASKEIWPSDGILGSEMGEKEQLKSIYLNASSQPDETPEENDENLAQNEESSEEGDDEMDEEEEEEAERHEVTTESEFDFRGFVEKYANVKIVSNYGKLFKHYESLSGDTIHQIIRMFLRISSDLDYAPMLCQATVFHTLQSVLKNYAQNERKEDLKPARDFFYFIWSKFTSLAEKNPKMFIEILFWKSNREAIEINEGYTPYHQTARASKKNKKNRRELSGEEENEILILAQEYNSLEEKPMKQVEWINHKMICGGKIKRVIWKFLEEKGLLLQNQKRRGKGTKRGQKEGEILHIVSKEFISSSDESSSSSQNSQSDNENIPVTNLHFQNQTTLNIEPSSSDSDAIFENLRKISEAKRREEEGVVEITDDENKISNSNASSRTKAKKYTKIKNRRRISGSSSSSSSSEKENEKNREDSGEIIENISISATTAQLSENMQENAIEEANILENVDNMENGAKSADNLENLSENFDDLENVSKSANGDNNVENLENLSNNDVILNESGAKFVDTNENSEEFKNLKYVSSDSDSEFLGNSKNKGKIVDKNRNSSGESLHENSVPIPSNSILSSDSDGDIQTKKSKRAPARRIIDSSESN